MESDPFYKDPTTYRNHTNGGWDVGAKQGSSLKVSRGGEIEQVGLFRHYGCWQVPARDGTLNSMLGVTDASGIITRYRHMSESSVDRILKGDPDNGVPAYQRGVEVLQGYDAGDVDDLGCSDPGFYHLHVEMVTSGGEILDAKNYILF